MVGRLEEVCTAKRRVEGAPVEGTTVGTVDRQQKQAKEDDRLTTDCCWPNHEQLREVYKRTKDGKREIVDQCKR